MAYTQHFKKDVSIIRVVFEFYPIKGGSVTHIVELSKKINPHLKNQILFAPIFNKDLEKSFDKNFEIPVVRIKHHTFRVFQLLKVPVAPLVLFFYAYNVVKEIKKSYNDIPKGILHVHGELLGTFVKFWLEFYKIKYPIIIMQHGGKGKSINPSWRSQSSNLLAKVFLRILKPNHYLMLDDGTEVYDFINWLRKNGIKCTTVYHAIDTDYYTPNSKNDLNEFIVLSNHRLDPVKRIDLAIKAFSKFLELTNYPENVKMIIAGSGTCEKELKEMVTKKKIEKWIEFVGEKNIDEIKEVIIQSDVIVGTSLASNLNRAIQEAMACGKPVVVFNSGRTFKLIKHLDNGILVEPGNIDEFAKWLKKLYEDKKLRIKLGKNARASIEKCRSWNSRIAKELSVYERIFKGFN